jgi:hypothetical protein
MLPQHCDSLTTATAIHIMAEIMTISALRDLKTRLFQAFARQPKTDSPVVVLVVKLGLRPLRLWIVAVIVVARILALVWASTRDFTGRRSGNVTVGGQTPPERQGSDPFLDRTRRFHIRRGSGLSG